MWRWQESPRLTLSGIHHSAEAFKYIGDAAAASVHIGAAFDLESGLARLELHVRSRGNATSVLALDLLSGAGAAQVVSLGPHAAALVPCTHYRVSVLAVNHADLHTRVTFPSALVYDPEPPAHGNLSVIDTLGAPISYQTTTTAVRLALSDFLAPRSGIRDYTVTTRYRKQVGTHWRTIRQTLVLPGTATTADIVSLDLHCGQPLTVTAYAASGAGVPGELKTASLTNVCAPPTAETVGFMAAHGVITRGTVGYLSADGIWVLGEEPLPPSPPPPPPPPATLCDRTCPRSPGWASDGDCDDGGLGSEYSGCDLGTDCTDCGVRVIPSPSPPPPVPAPPAPALHCVPLGTSVQGMWSFSSSSASQATVSDYSVALVKATAAGTIASSISSGVSGSGSTLSVSGSATPASGFTAPLSGAALESVGVRTSSVFSTSGLESAPTIYDLVVRACDVVGQCATESAQLTLVDGPPGGGEAILQTTASGHLVDPTRVNGSWAVGQAGLDLTYETCMGTTPYGCEASAFATAAHAPSELLDGYREWRSGPLTMPCGEALYMTVRATNCAGLSHVFASLPATLCCSAPVDGAVSVLDDAGEVVRYTSSNASLSVSWSGFAEPCSGVRTFIVALIDEDGNVMWELERSPLSNEAAVDRLAFVADASYAVHGRVLRARVTAIGVSGLSASQLSVPFVIEDTEPVDLAVDVTWQGRDATAVHTSLSSALCLPWSPDSNPPLVVRWLSVNETESEVRYALASTPEADTAAVPSSSWQPMGRSLLTQVAASTLAIGMPRVYHVQACNSIGLCSVSASPPVMRVRAPQGDFAQLLPCNDLARHNASRAADGPIFLTEANRTCGAFAFPDQLRLSYEVCLGTTPYGCQVSAFASAPQQTAWSADSLDLVCGATYYMTVRATNCGGLQDSVASAGAKLCCEGPTAGSVSVVDASENVVQYATANDSLTVRWSGFAEPCSGVRMLVVALKSVATGAQLWSTNVTSRQTSAVDVGVDVGSLPSGGSFFVQVMAESYASLTTTVASAPFAVDLSPPVWAGLQGTEQLSMRWNGLDELAPFTGLSDIQCLPSAVDEIALSWRGWVDAESTVAAYQLVDLMASNTSWQEHGSAVSATISTASLTLATADIDHHQFALRACNGVGLCSEAVSQPLLRVHNAPSGGSAEIGPLAEIGSPEIGPPAYSGDESVRLLSDPSRVTVSWAAFNASGVHNVSSKLQYEACLGTTAFGCQVVSFVSAGLAAGGPHSFSFDSLALPCGVSYFVTVRATNCAGLRHAVASEGARLCCSSPAAGSVSVADADGLPVQYATRHTPLSVSWSDFSEPCSGVRWFTVALLDEGGSELLQLWEGAPNSSTASYTVTIGNLADLASPSGASIVQDSHRVRVMATSALGLNTSATSASFSIDEQAPAARLSVFDGADGARDLSCASLNVPLGCAWSSPLRNHSGAPLYAEWALGTAALGSDVQPFQRVALTTLSASAAAPPNLAPGTLVYCSVRLTKPLSNLSSVFSSDGVRLIDSSTCPAPYACLPSPWSQLISLSYAWLPGKPAMEADEPPMREHLYEVTSRIVLPTAGQHTLHSRLRLTEHARAELPSQYEEDTKNASGAASVGAVVVGRHALYELRFERNLFVNDDKGMSSSLLGKHDMRKHPLYFRQAASGEIIGLHHHPDEDPRVLGSKRVFVATLQHSLALAQGPSAGGTRRRMEKRIEKRDWSTVETDAVGPADTEYSVRGGGGYLRPKLVVYKKQKYRKSAAVPEGFQMEQNTTLQARAPNLPASPPSQLATT